eukprot:15355346-Ditylum_brightwellii.AAC.1
MAHHFVNVKTTHKAIGQIPLQNVSTAILEIPWHHESHKIILTLRHNLNFQKFYNTDNPPCEKVITIISVQPMVDAQPN